MADFDDTQFNMDQLQGLLDGGDMALLMAEIQGVKPADIADFLEDQKDDVRVGIFRAMDDELASDVMAELSASCLQSLLRELNSALITRLVQEMPSDDAAGIIAELDDDALQEVLQQVPENIRDELAPVLVHEEDAAGHMMTTELLSMRADQTVQEARQQLATMENEDPILYAYITDPESEAMVGFVMIQQLFSMTPQTALKDIMETEFVFSTPDEDREDVALRFQKYDLWVMPVLDDDKKIVGRITVDDIMDVMHEELSEDIAHIVGAPDIEEEEEAPTRIVRKRLPWLLITLIAGLVNSVIIKSMLNVTDIVAIAIFIPAILAMGGNTGMQSSTIAVRGIALGEQRFGKLKALVTREILVGLMLGVICGVVAGALVVGTLSIFGGDTGEIPQMKLAAIVAISMCNSMVFASSFGALLPVFIHRLGVDPALASGPFVTTSNDISATLIYFATSVVLLSI